MWGRGAKLRCSRLMRLPYPSAPSQYPPFPLSRRLGSLYFNRACGPCKSWLARSVWCCSRDLSRPHQYIYIMGTKGTKQWWKSGVVKGMYVFSEWGGVHATEKSYIVLTIWVTRVLCPSRAILMASPLQTNNAEVLVFLDNSADKWSIFSGTLVSFGCLSNKILIEHGSLAILILDSKWINNQALQGFWGELGDPSSDCLWD